MRRQHVIIIAAFFARRNNDKNGVASIQLRDPREAYIYDIHEVAYKFYHMLLYGMTRIHAIDFHFDVAIYLGKLYIACQNVFESIPIVDLPFS